MGTSVSVKVVVGKRTLKEAMAKYEVRRKLREVADVIGPIAIRMALEASNEFLAESIRIENGTRPGTNSPNGFARPYSRVVATSEGALAQEYGDVGVDRTAIIRRAAEAGR